MELKRLLARATALLLQGAYQGAESFIEQAIAESDKLKQELAEIDTLRTRVTEMASEVERLQSVIDEANAQPQHTVLIGRDEWPRSKQEQQSPAVAVPEIISDQLENFICYLIDKEEGAVIAEETLHHQLAAFLSNEKYNKPSPRITEQDAREIARQFNIFRSQGHALAPDGIINKWLRSDEGRALLNKLNDTKND